MEINGKTAVVTGAGSGIGRAIAVRLAREGAQVVAADLCETATAETTAMIKEIGGTAFAAQTDVTDDPALHRLFSATGRVFGGVDILVNNAGVATGTPHFPETPAEKWARTVAINLTAVIRATQLAIPLMQRRGGGVIINIASMAGLNGFVLDPVYAATKGGVVMFTRSLAPLKERDNISVVAICPGAVDTNIWRRAEDPQLRYLIDQIPFLAPDEIADAVAALIRDEAAAGKALRITPGQPADFAP